jgi:probable DNA metabolism protein
MGREKAALYNGERIVVVPLSGRLEMAVDEDEMKYSAMFKKYFSAVSISTRKNPRLQRSFLPVRYRECMTEFQT